MTAKEYTYQSILEALDTQAWQDAKKRFYSRQEALSAVDAKTYPARLDKNYSKYFDLTEYVRVHFNHVRRIGLEKETKPKNVLDLGCGSGLFLAICQHIGHRGVGLDVGSEMYRDMAIALGVERRVGLILPQEPLPQDLQGFDVITAMSTKFDREDFANPGVPTWTAADWKFFFTDLAQRLNEGGIIYVSPNKWREPDRFPDRDNVIAYFDRMADTKFEHEKFIFTREKILADM